MLRALEKDPAARFDNMSDFCAALEEPTAPARARPWRALFIAAATIAGLMFLLWPKPAPKGLPTEPTPAPPTATKVSGDPAETSQLEPVLEFVKIELSSRPSKAFVAVNGNNEGRTPLTLKLRRGAEATVRFSLQGYRSQEHRLVPTEDNTLVVRLKKKSRPKPPSIKTDF